MKVADSWKCHFVGEQLQNISSISQVEIEEDSSFRIPDDLRQKLYLFSFIL